MSRLGRYELEGKLATGGMAEVFLARLTGEQGFARQVVIKRVLPQYASHPDFLALFQQEARFASLLAHPNIAQVSDFGVDGDGAAYLVMEYVDGASLRELIRRAAALGERTDWRLVCRVLSQVADALGAVHATQDPVTHAPLELVHRDVSPENVLLSRQGAVKLADFGIARATSQASTTSPDVIRGKLRYLAPEQVLGERITSAVDVWALGVTLFEALTLQRPFPEDNEGQTVNAIVHGLIPTPLAALRADLPAPLVAVVQRCLARAPAERWADCHDLAHELERIASAGEGSVTAKMVGNWVERLVPATSLAPLPAPAAPAASLFGTAGTHESPEWAVAPAPTTAPVPAPAAPLELARPSPPPVEPTEPSRVEDEKPARSARRGVLLALGAVVLVAGAALLGQRALRPARRQVLITSTPPGATVRNGSLVLGETPWAGDLPRDVAIELELSAPGRRTVKHLLPPGEERVVDVKLPAR